MFTNFVNYRYQKFIYKLDTKLNPDLGESFKREDPINYDISTSMFVSSMSNRFYHKIIHTVQQGHGNPLLEPFKSTYAFEIFKNQLLERLYLTPESQFDALTSDMFNNKTLQSRLSQDHLTSSMKQKNHDCIKQKIYQAEQAKSFNE